MKNWKAIAGVCLVFLLGCIGGCLATTIIIHKRVQHFVDGGPQAVHHAIVRRLTHNLKLDAGQQTKVGALVEEAGGKIKEVRHQFQPQVASILDDYRAKIREGLNADQQKKFDDLVAKNKARFQQFQ